MVKRLFCFVQFSSPISRTISVTEEALSSTILFKLTFFEASFLFSVHFLLACWHVCVDLCYVCFFNCKIINLLSAKNESLFFFPITWNMFIASYLPPSLLLFLIFILKYILLNSSVCFLLPLESCLKICHF